MFLSKQQQLAEIIRAAIKGGIYAPGSRLPNLRELGDTYGVGASTALQAVRVLVKEGLVTTQATGTYVNLKDVPLPPMAMRHQICAELRTKILDGTYPPGCLIPTSSELACSYGVSSATANQAVALLHADGLIEGRRGIGRRVRNTADWSPELTAGFAETRECEP